MFLPKCLESKFPLSVIASFRLLGRSVQAAPEQRPVTPKAVFGLIALLALAIPSFAQDVSSITVSPSSLVGGSAQTTTATITLTAPATANVGVTLSYGPPTVVFHNFTTFLVIPVGQTTGTLTFSADTPVASNTVATIYATVSTQVHTSLTLAPFSISVDLNPFTITGDNNHPPNTTTATVTVNPPPRTQEPIVIGSSNQNVVATTTQFIQAGASTVQFSLTGNNGFGPQTIIITATLGVSASGVLCVVSCGTETGAPTQCEKGCGIPINLTNGNVWIAEHDYSVPGLGGGLDLTRTWNSMWRVNNPTNVNGIFGESWRSTYEEQLNVSSTDPVIYNRGDGSNWVFHFDSPTQTFLLISPADQRATMTHAAATPFNYTMTFLDGSQRIFNNSGYLIAIIDRNGNTTNVSYNASNLVNQVSNAASGSTLTFNYGTGAQANLVTSISDSIGQTTIGQFSTYTYDSSSRLIKVTYPDGSTLNFTFDVPNNTNNILTITDFNGKTIEAHTYDAQNRGLTSSLANGQNKVTVTYTSSTQTSIQDSNSQDPPTTYDLQSIEARFYIKQITGSGCATCGGRGNNTYTYDASANRMSSKDPNGNTTSFTYDASGNVLTRSITVNSSPITWTYTYNSFGEVLSAADPLGNTTNNGYDSKGNLKTTQTPSPDGISAGFTTTFNYDTGGLGELISVTDPLGNVTSMTYTPSSTLCPQAFAVPVGLICQINDAQNNVTKFTYDRRGNRLTAVDALNKTTSFTYDLMNRLTVITYPDSTTTHFAYDTRGRRISVTDGNGKVTNYAYDDADRLSTVTDAANNMTAYGYDSESTLTSITDAKSRTTQFTPDTLGRVKTVTFPSNLTESYTYDGVGNVLTKKDRNANTINYAYDPLNRLTLKTYPDTTTVAYTYDTASHLTQVVDPLGTYSLSYDGLGRLKQTTTTYTFLSGHNLSVSYTYDAASNRYQMTDAEGGVTTYTPDTLNRLATLAPPPAISSGSFGFAYDALSRRTTLTRPNSVNTTYAYDTLSRLTSITHQKSGTTLDGASYVYDNAGNRSSRTPLPSGTASNFTYDLIYELTKVMQGSTTKENYTYDAVGNRLTSLTVSNYAYTSSNEITTEGATTYTWDNNGNLATRVAAATSTWAWDFENRLLQTVSPNDTPSTVNYKYDPFGRRIYKSSTAGTTIYVYDGDNIIEELDANGNSVARYAQGLGIDEPLAMLRSSATSFYQADGLGSITSLSNSSGAIAATYAYDSFGKNAGRTGTITNPYQFAGREFDSETGQYYNRARYYMPWMGGRFINEDPIRSPIQRNHYKYVRNDPVNRIDSSGMRDRRGCALVGTSRLTAWTSQTNQTPISGWRFLTSFQVGPESPFPQAVVTCFWERDYTAQLWGHVLTVYRYKCWNDSCNFIFGPSEYEKVDFNWTLENLGKVTGKQRDATQLPPGFGAEDETNDILCVTGPRPRP